jgi:signal transduction histidine kinase
VSAEVARRVAANAAAALAPYDVLDALHAEARAGLMAHVLGALILAITYFHDAPPLIALVWTLAFLLACVARWQAWRRYRLRQPGNADDERGARRCWDLANLLAGAVWGLAVLLYYPWADVPQRIGLTVLVCVLCLVVPATRYGVYMATLGLGLGPILAEVLWSGQPHRGALSAVLLLVFLCAGWTAHYYRRAFGQLFALKERVQAQAAQLADEKARAEQATQSKTRFFAAASHDLRQPLQALLLFADGLRYQPLPAAAAEQVEQLGDALRSLEAMFDALLDLSQLEAGAVTVNLRPVRLSALYRSLDLHLRPLAFDRGLVLECRGQDRWVQADPVLLERILRNLLVNALNCTEDGGVLLTCRPRGPAHWALQVWDTGCGIEATVLPHVFDEFFRAGRAASGRDKGVGLGLSIAQGLAELLGSRLTVRSTSARGTVFTLLLPRAEPLPAGAPESLVPHYGGQLAGRNLWVLDSPGAPREALIDTLQAWQAQVHAMDSLQAFQTWAAQRLASGGAAPALLMLGGWALTQQAEVLAVCGQAWPAAARCALLLGASEVLADAGWHRSLVLVPPLAPHRLRASITAVLQAGP